MNCKKCGNILEPTDTVCKNCGEPVVNINNNMPMQNGQVVTPNVGNNIEQPVPTQPQPVQNNIPSFVQSSETVPNMIAPTLNNEANINSGQQIPEPNTMVNNNTPNNPQPTVNPIAPTPAPVPAEPLNQNPQPLNQNMMQQPVGVQQTNQQLNSANVAPMQSVPSELPDEPVKKKDSPVVVALLIIALIGIIAFIVIYLTKPFDKKDNTNTNNENQEVVDQTTENTNFASWMNYILEQNITNITLERTTEDSSGNKTATLTNEQLDGIFTKLAGYQLVKRYYEGSGFTFGDVITISYTIGDNNYDIKIANGEIWTDDTNLKDEALLNAFEDSEHTTENEEIKDNEGVFVKYILQNYDSTIFDEYLNQEQEEETEEVQTEAAE